MTLAGACFSKRARTASHIVLPSRLIIGRVYANTLKGLIVRAIIGIARDLDMQTIAEGIETEEQRQILEALGCDSGQGYLFCKPLPAAEFLPRLLEHSVS
ncbi:EAL domain-containing protein [Azotobacter chroococcum]|uniref:EAL domain-containing protein n=1 Tax=Azotobacter chroococcum TaxID=353 RepID=UPI0009E59043|nr:EAL domain-containing protein [Azotobacter chroococcum]